MSRISLEEKPPVAQAVSFYDLVNLCRSELARIDVDSRDMHLVSKESFRKWMMHALSAVAEKLGLAVGHIVAVLDDVYESVKGGFARGFREGMKKGRAR